MSMDSGLRQETSRDIALVQKLGLEEMRAFLAEVFPNLTIDGPSYVVEAVGPGTARLRLFAHPRHIRPGGTMSGPAAMLVADLGIYLAVLSVIGKVPLAVTTSLNINFLAKPPPGDLIGESRILKAGKRLVVGETTIYSDGSPAPVAHATATYSVPPGAVK